MEKFLISVDGRQGLRKPIEVESERANVGNIIELKIGESVGTYEIVDILPGRTLTSRAVTRGQRKTVQVERTLVLRSIRHGG